MTENDTGLDEDITTLASDYTPDFETGATAGGGTGRGAVNAVRSFSRARIELRPEIPEMKEETLAALIAMGGIYQRGGKIATAGRTLMITQQGPVVALQAVRMQRGSLLDAMARAAEWHRRVMGKHGPEEVPCNPSRDVAEALLTQTVDLPLPPLSGIATAPFLRRDGSLCMPPVSGAHYDSTTGLYLDGAGVVFEPPVAGATRADALAAVEALFAPMREFDFVGGTRGIAACAAMAALLTPFARPACAAVPGFLFTAPVKGSGKSMLASLAPLLATGSPAGLISPTRGESEEFEKRLNAALLTGRPHHLIDNIENDHWGVPLLCSALTEPVIDLRPLGTSDLVPTPNTYQFALTGNNVTPPGDVSRRVVTCRLVPDTEDPAAREFDFDPRAEVLAKRVPLTRAALTILMAYQVEYGAGRRMRGREMGSFEDWTRLVRDALVWLGFDDCVVASEAAPDEKRDTLAAFLAAWRDLPRAALSSDGVPVADMVRVAAATSERDEGSDGGEIVHPAFREALLAAVPERGGGLPSAQRIGKWLASEVDRRVPGGQGGTLYVAREGGSNMGVRWSLRSSENRSRQSGSLL